jgi:hypothetical protein
MIKQIDYDFTKFSYAYKSLSEYLDILERDVRLYIGTNRGENDPEKFLEHFKITNEKLLEKELILNAIHVTTNNDECHSIKQYGLVNLQQAVLLDTPIRRYLKAHDVVIDINNKALAYKGEKYNIIKKYKGLSTRTPLEWIIYKFYEDYQVNAFFSSENALKYDGEVSSRPEFLMNLSKFLKSASIEDDWRNDRDNKCYVLKIKVPLADISDTLIFDHDNDIDYMEQEEIDVLKRKWVIQKTLDVINDLYNGFTPERFCEMKFEASVSPNNIKIYNSDEYLLEYGQ